MYSQQPRQRYSRGASNIRHHVGSGRRVNSGDMSDARNGGQNVREGAITQHRSYNGHPGLNQAPLPGPGPSPNTPAGYDYHFPSFPSVHTQAGPRKPSHGAPPSSGSPSPSPLPSAPSSRSSSSTSSFISNTSSSSVPTEEHPSQSQHQKPGHRGTRGYRPSTSSHPSHASSPSPAWGSSWKDTAAIDQNGEAGGVYSYSSAGRRASFSLPTAPHPYPPLSTEGGKEEGGQLLDVPLEQEGGTLSYMWEHMSLDESGQPGPSPYTGYEHGIYPPTFPPSLPPAGPPPPASYLYYYDSPSPGAYGGMPMMYGLDTFSPYQDGYYYLPPSLLPSLPPSTLSPSYPPSSFPAYTPAAASSLPASSSPAGDCGYKGPYPSRRAEGREREGGGRRGGRGRGRRGPGRGYVAVSSSMPPSVPAPRQDRGGKEGERGTEEVGRDKGEAQDVHSEGAAAMGKESIPATEGKEAEEEVMEARIETGVVQISQNDSKEEEPQGGVGFEGKDGEEDEEKEENREQEQEGPQDEEPEKEEEAWKTPPQVLPTGDPVQARFFVIKSFSPTDVVQSVHHSLWASTEPGNARLDRAYREAAVQGIPVYLFFSVNESRRFCGVALMSSPVDFNTSFPAWMKTQTHRWRGVFNVRWLSVKDVPNAALRHITLANNQNRPFPRSRDTQEVPFNEGNEALQIMNDHAYHSSILDGQDILPASFQDHSSTISPAGAPVYAFAAAPHEAQYSSFPGQSFQVIPPQPIASTFHSPPTHGTSTVNGNGYFPTEYPSYQYGNGFSPRHVIVTGENHQPWSSQFSKQQDRTGRYEERGEGRGWGMGHRGNGGTHSNVGARSRRGSVYRPGRGAQSKVGEAPRTKEASRKGAKEAPHVNLTRAKSNDRAAAHDGQGLELKRERTGESVDRGGYQAIGKGKDEEQVVVVIRKVDDAVEEFEKNGDEHSGQAPLLPAVAPTALVV